MSAGAKRLKSSSAKGRRKHPFERRKICSPGRDEPRIDRRAGNAENAAKFAEASQGVSVADSLVGDFIVPQWHAPPKARGNSGKANET